MNNNNKKQETENEEVIEESSLAQENEGVAQEDSFLTQGETHDVIEKNIDNKEEANSDSPKENEEPPVLEYDKARLSKRVCANFIDIFITIFLTFIMFACSNLVLPNISSYQNIVEARYELQLESGLYVSIDDDVLLITEYTETEDAFENTESKKTYLSNAIDTFYSNTLFFVFDEDDTHLSDYEQRKLSYIHSEGGTLFTTDEEGNVVERNVNQSYLYDFYYEEVNSYSLGYLIGNEDYITYTRIIFLTSIFIIIVWYLIFVVIFYYVIPVTLFKRGRQTLGMKICTIGLIDGNALNITLKKFSLRFVFQLIFLFMLNIAAFLIPLIISYSMMYLSKASQDLTDYIFNNYVVDTKNQDIYLNYMEFLDKTNFERKITIESKDFTVKS